MKHLTKSQRYLIAQLLKNNFSKSKIAKIVEKDKAVIIREIRRNSDPKTGEYDPEQAQEKYEKRLQSKPRVIRFTPEMKKFVREKLAQDWSPEQIAGWCKREKIKMVSHETIYKFIWADKRAGGTLHEHLRRRRRKYRKRGDKYKRRGMIKNRVGIEHRPAIVDEKKRFGDLEIDTVIGKNHRGALLTINDRATGYCWLRALKSKNADELAAATIDALAPFAPWLHTITSDNGKEFARHEKIAKALNVKFFFARPYHSWERGANENLNGLIRQYLPKKTSFKNLDKKIISLIQSKLNTRPRKKINFLAPNLKIKNNFVA